MIHWTRQIKEVLRAQEAVESRESSGPLEEIQFWRNRCTDLSEISKQLYQPGVKHIEAILALAKSSYVTPFQRLAKQIQVGGAGEEAGRDWPRRKRVSGSLMQESLPGGWEGSRKELPEGSDTFGSMHGSLRPKPTAHVLF